MSEPQSNPKVVEAIDALCAGADLGVDQTEAVLAEIMAGKVGEIQTAGFLIALRAKGETPAEIAGLAKAMRSFAAAVTTASANLVDTAGTGGGRRTFNVSTTAALIAAGAGCAVAKHGNRSATGPSGSADLLEALGVSIDLPPERVGECIEQVGFGFMFAPAHHSATRHVVPVRKGLGTRTAFNLLGPLTNPAGAARQVIGVGDPSALETVAGALALLGVERALVVASDDGLDELSTSGETTVLEVGSSGVSRWTVTPEEVGLDRADPEAVAGAGPVENAAVTRSILAGDRGAPRDLAVLNAGAAILVGGLADSLETGVRLAEQAIDDGSATSVLERLVAFTAGAGQ
ncbi:MAG: anthranilate phosphoribosyltransferase [Actinomycetes bacterium]